MAPMFQRQRSYLDIVICLSTVTLVVVMDRLTKILFSNILQVGESIPVIKRVFHFTLVHNTGIAFGLFRDNGFVFFVIPVIAVVLLGYNLYYYHKVGELDLMYIIGFSLIMGGAIGNLVDRITLGHVIDFIDLRVWPVFNVADSAITVGACVVMFKCCPWFVRPKQEKHFNLPD